MADWQRCTSERELLPESGKLAQAFNDFVNHGNKKKKKGSRVDNVMIQLQVNAPTVVKTRYRTTSSFKLFPISSKMLLSKLFVDLKATDER